jgi:hypothetical protein
MRDLGEGGAKRKPRCDGGGNEGQERKERRRALRGVLGVEEGGREDKRGKEKWAWLWMWWWKGESGVWWHIE